MLARTCRNAKVKNNGGQRADWEKMNCSSTLVLTTLTTISICNVWGASSLSPMVP